MRSPSAGVWRDYLSLGLVIVLFMVLPEAGRWFNRLYLTYRNPKAFRADREKEISVDIELDGIQVVGDPNKEDWSHFSNYTESPNAFILYRSNTIETILPKRAFSPDSLSSCRQILEANIETL